MPHITIEYSANLADIVAIPDLLATVHQATVASGIFEIAAIRTRAVGRELAIAGDGTASNGFVLVTVRMKAGRPPAVQETLGKSLLEAAAGPLARAFAERQVTLNVEIHDIPELNFRHRSGDA